jgi:hypothetical protein
MHEDLRQALLQTLNIVAALAERVDRLEQTRWVRFKAWFRRNVYDGTPVFTPHTSQDERAL